MSLLSITNRTTSVNAYAKTFPNIVPYNTGTSWASPDIFVIDNSGNIYFAANGGSAIYKTTIAGTTPVLFAGSPTQSGSGGVNVNYLNSRFTTITDLAIDGNSILYVVDANWVSYLTTIGTAVGTIASHSGFMQKISVNLAGTRFLIYDGANQRLYYYTCTSVPYGGTIFSSTITLAYAGRPTSISSLSCLPDGGSGTFFVVLPYPPTYNVPNGGGFRPQAGNTVYSVTSFDGMAGSATFTGYTIDGSASAPQADYYQYLLFSSSTAGYALVASSNYNVITVNTSSTTITTNSGQSLLGNGNLSIASKLGFYSDSLNTAVVLSSSGNSDGLLAIQPTY